MKVQGKEYLVFKTHAFMIRYTSANQLTIEGFEHPFQKELDPNNRWVILSNLIPWDELATIYSRNLHGNSGRLTVDIRMVIGALIVKHRLGLSDRDTVEWLFLSFKKRVADVIKATMKQNQGPIPQLTN